MQPLDIFARPSLDRRLQLCFLAVIAFAFVFGFMDSYFHRDFERLHIFLFNLTAGGFILLVHSEERSRVSFRLYLFLGLSVLYSVCAFLKYYPAAIAATLALFFIVEHVRVSTFGFFPRDFFRIGPDISKKFHESALICLSLSLLIAPFVILNSEYYHWFDLRKLTLNVFFLGFSFPVSLLCFSVIARFIERSGNRIFQWGEHLLFWVINLGVIVFFLFILLEFFWPMVIAAVILALAVLTVFYTFFRFGLRTRQKHFLVSGMFFLLFTAFTGISYIFIKKMPGSDSVYGPLLLKTHAFLALYGWNLSGLLVIMRGRDFPLRFNSLAVILCHWFLIFLAVSAGMFPPIIPAASAGFLLFLAYFHLGLPRDN